MSVLTSSNRIDYTADGIATTFAFPFVVYTQTDLQVYVTPTGGTAVLKVLNTDYTQTAVNVPGGQAGGNVIFSSPPTSSYQVTLIRKVPILQQTSFTNLDKFDAKTAIEGTYDKVVMIEQQLNEVVSRAPVLPVDSLLNPEFPLPGASKFIRWNSSGTALEAVDITGTLPVSMDAFQAVATAGLPVAGQAGRARYVTDASRGLWIDQGNQFYSVTGGVYNVKEFGATGNGTTDDTSAIQACFAAAIAALSGTIVFPQGVYKHTALTLAPAASQIHINLVGLGGAGANGVRLNYVGTGGTALTITNNTRYQVSNLRFQNGGTGAIGIALNSLAAGSNHGPAEYHNVYVTGFTTNVQIGDTSNKAASEIDFFNLEVDTATTGVLIQGPASGTAFSTNLRFYGPGFVSCTTGLVVAGDVASGLPVVSVWGGGSSGNTLDYDFQIPGVYRIACTYAEIGTGQFIRSGNPTATANSALATHVALDNVLANYSGSPSNFIALFYQPGHYSVRDSLLQTGSIRLGGFNGGAGARKSNLIVENSTIVSADPRIEYKASSNTIWNVRHIASGNTATESVNQDDDRHYLIHTDGTEYDLTRTAWSKSAASLTASGVYTAADTTPTVAGTNVLTIANAAPTTITMFDDGITGQIITLIFSDGNTTISDAANLKLNGGFTSSADDTMVLVFDGTNWYEVSRSAN